MTHAADGRPAGFGWTKPDGESWWREFGPVLRPKVVRAASVEHPAGLHRQVEGQWVHIPWKEVDKTEVTG